MPPLDRTFALEEVHDLTVLVAEHLYFDVTRPVDQPLHVQRAVAERGCCLAARRLSGFENLGGLPDAAHAFAAATCRRLD